MRLIAPSAASTPETFDLVFVSQAIDERGSRSLEIARNSANHVVEVDYDPETFHLKLGDAAFRASDLDSIRQAFPGAMILLDATSLDPVEMLILSRAFLYNAEDRRRLGFVYAEPAHYKPATVAIGMDYAFTFADKFRGLKSVPGFANELRDDEGGRLVACLGFEADRLDRILQDDDGNFIKHVTLIFGVPPYRTTWEMHALLPHERVISKHRSCELAFAGANNPKATYECLKESFQAIGQGERLIIAPLGSKPSSIGIALFACCRDNIRLKYDFPVKLEGRTEGVGAIHRYLVDRR
ncbi:MAG: hypothetical protein M0P72_05500 [Metallibacterium scheffleri]|uniref:hypothetical protein n=1 Tax=Metallibacterium scheffleri TaxID=993689 RepID=UPI0026EEE2F7|nr:hypothetical protein [Metallibacterium scheffleri]MCK9366585.1 hypothetical protein [Metallibacterium scheffleri]